jgi:6,7-dimethyl-8-ribityllumazine synthase
VAHAGDSILSMARPDENRRPVTTLPPDTRVAAVVSTYHREVTGGMFRSAARTLVEAGLDASDLFEVQVPGTFEIPLVARRLAQRADVDGVLCFGLVLRGETDHDRYIASAVAHELMRVGIETDTPVLFGVLTCNTLAQAEERARPREQGGQDKGHEVARALIEVLVALERAQSGFPQAHPVEGR